MGAPSNLRDPLLPLGALVTYLVVLLRSKLWTSKPFWLRLLITASIGFILASISTIASLIIPLNLYGS